MHAIRSLLIMLLSSVCFISCKKSDTGSSPAAKLPILTTTEGSAITSTTAKTGGTITSDGGSAITARGVCWSDFTTPTITDSITVNGTGTGSFTSVLTGLKPYHAYTVRAYATNSSGTAYGNVVIILTSPGVTIHTTDIQVSRYVRSCETTITIDGLDDINFKPITQSGLCIAATANPTIAGFVLTNGPLSLLIAILWRRSDLAQIPLGIFEDL